MNTKQRRKPDTIVYDSCYGPYVYDNVSFLNMRRKLGLTQKQLALILHSKNCYICCVERKNAHVLMIKRHANLINDFNDYIDFLVREGKIICENLDQ